jgi:hypothetical protein
MTGPLTLRTVVAPAQYAATEAVPRSWVDALVTPVRVLAQQVKTAQTNLNNQFISLRNRVVLLELWIKGTRVYVHNVTEPELSWTIVHNFNVNNIAVNVYEDDEEVIPKTVKIVDANTVRVDFAIPSVGRAEVSPKVVF